MVNAQVLQNALNENVVSFVYAKADGTIRTAVGTRNKEIIDLFVAPKEKKSNRKVSDSVLIYFDLTRLDFRCCRRDKIIAIEDKNYSVKSALQYAKKIAALDDCGYVVNALENAIGDIDCGNIIISGGVDRFLSGDCGGVSVRLTNSGIKERLQELSKRVDNLMENCKSIKRDLQQLEIEFA